MNGSPVLHLCIDMVLGTLLQSYIYRIFFLVLTTLPLHTHLDQFLGGNGGNGGRKSWMAGTAGMTRMVGMAGMAGMAEWRNGGRNGQMAGMA